MSLVGAALTACNGGPKTSYAAFERFNVALCPKIPFEPTTPPLDPNLEGIKANIALVSHQVPASKFVRISLTFTNAAQHDAKLALPQSAFSLQGYSLVDHACTPVPYQQTATPKALAGTTGPMPLKQGDSATLDLSLDDLAPGLTLAAGVYALRLALKVEPSSPVVRGRTIWSPWTVFAVVPPAS